MSARPTLATSTVRVFAVCVCLFARAGVAAAHTPEVLHSLSGIADGAQPGAPLIQATDGGFYGTTPAGGSAGLGTVFKVTPSGTFTVLHHFAGGSDGAQPYAPLFQSADGYFYGTTSMGGAANKGTIFRMTSGGALAVLWSFGQLANDGTSPYAGLIQARDGNFYGTTLLGGNGYGTIFRMTPSGALTVLYSGFGFSNGASPRATLLEASDGNLYGTTLGMGGGPYCCGTAFRFTTSGTFTVIHHFGLNGIAFPSTPLVEGDDGYLYGTSGSGSYHGLSWSPRIYRMSLEGNVIAIPMSVGYPVSGLTRGPDGALYGAGGYADFGMLFRMTSAGALTVLHVFAGAPLDGATPVGRLTLGIDGHLYGTSRYGGASNDGTVFRLVDPTRTVTTAGPSLAADFDGDGKTDLVVFRPTTGTWFVRNSSSNYSSDAAWTSYQWGLAGDVPLAADFDGDRKSELTVYRPATGEWFVRFSMANDNYANWTSYQWGLPGDVPLVADFDGDGRTDLVVFRPSTGVWYVRDSSSNYGRDTAWRSYQWGLAGDIPLAADLDGDHKSDLTVYRPTTGEWFVRGSTSDYTTWTSHQWGLPGDVPLAADVDGDDRTDLCVWRPGNGTWHVRLSTSDYSYATWTSYEWGVVGDVPLVGDFDGDGRTDLSVWRPVNGTWYMRFSRSDYSIDAWLSYQWGLPGDTPL